MPFPDLSPFPAWAQVLVYSMFGISLAVIIGLGRVGIIHGKKDGSGGSGKAEVAAMIMDASAIRDAAMAVEALTSAVTSLTGAVRDAAVHQNRVAEELNRVREEMRIHREVSQR